MARDLWEQLRSGVGDRFVGAVSGVEITERDVIEEHGLLQSA